MNPTTIEPRTPKQIQCTRLWAEIILPKQKDPNTAISITTGKRYIYPTGKEVEVEEGEKK